MYIHKLGLSYSETVQHCPSTICLYEVENFQSISLSAFNYCSMKFMQHDRKCWWSSDEVLLYFPAVAGELI